MVSFADKPILDLTIEEWERYLAGTPDDVFHFGTSAPGGTATILWQ